MRTREDLGSPSAASSPPLPVKAQAKLHLRRSVARQVSTAPEDSRRARAKDIQGRIDWPHVVQHVDEVKIHRPADSTAAETSCNGRSKLKPYICSGLGRR